MTKRNGLVIIDRVSRVGLDAAAVPMKINSDSQAEIDKCLKCIKTKCNNCLAFNQPRSKARYEVYDKATDELLCEGRLTDVADAMGFAPSTLLTWSQKGHKKYIVVHKEVNYAE